MAFTEVGESFTKRFVDEEIGESTLPMVSGRLVERPMAAW